MTLRGIPLRPPGLYIIWVGNWGMSCRVDERGGWQGGGGFLVILIGEGLYMFEMPY